VGLGLGPKSFGGLANPHSPVDRYVACSGGNDSNSGITPGAAWATTNNVDAVTFGPGDNLYLQAGCSHAPFTLSGGGEFDAIAADSAYTTARAATISALDGGTDWTRVYTPTNALFGAAEAERTADIYIAAAGNLAGLEAIWSSPDLSKMVRVTRYGAGAKPVVSGGGATQTCIRLPRATAKGGWLFEDIDISGCTIAGIDFDEGGLTAGTGGSYSENPFTGPNNGLVIRRVNISNITDGIVQHPQAPLAAGYFWAWPQALGLQGHNYMLIEDVDMSVGNDDPFYILHGNRWLFRRVNASNSIEEHPAITGADMVGFDDARFNNNCSGHAYPDGAAGFYIAGARDITSRNVEFNDTKRGTGTPVPDGMGLDHEWGVRRHVCLFPAAAGLGCEFKNNRGEGLMFFQNGGAPPPWGAQDVDNIFAGVELSGNGTHSPGGGIAMIRTRDTGRASFIEVNGVRSVLAQKGYDCISCGGQSDTPQADWVGLASITGP
jgi:hypothetical protein